MKNSNAYVEYPSNRMKASRSFNERPWKRKSPADTFRGGLAIGVVIGILIGLIF